MRRVVRLVDEYDFDDPEDKKLLFDRINSAVPSMGTDASQQSVVGQAKLGSDPSSPSAICEMCGKDIFKISKTPEKTIEYSQKFHDGVFCYYCQQKLRKKKEEEAD